MKGNLKITDEITQSEIEVSRETNKYDKGMIAITSYDEYHCSLVNLDRSDMERIITALQQTIKTLGDD